VSLPDVVTASRKTGPVTISLGAQRRFWLKVATADNVEGCWLWTAATVRGYGVINIGGKVTYAHRVAYELWRGPIPDGLDIDHLCRTPRCVNAWHMEPVTRAENRRRAPISGQAKVHAAKTHCINGHALTPDNLIRFTNPKFGRQCRRCHRERSRASEARRREVVSR